MHEVFKNEIARKTGRAVHRLSYIGYIDGRNLFDVYYFGRPSEVWECELERFGERWEPICWEAKIEL